MQWVDRRQADIKVIVQSTTTSATLLRRRQGKATEDAEQDAFIGLIIPYVRIGLLSDMNMHSVNTLTKHTSND